MLKDELMGFGAFSSVGRISLFALLASSTFAAEPEKNVWPASWTEPTEPFRVFGDTYYVGTRGLTSVLIASPNGHVLIDGGMPEAASLILANIRKLGFSVSDIKYILNSHAHLDHSGGIAELQKASNATVISSPAGAHALRRGRGGPDDPQFTVIEPFPAVANVEVLEEGSSIDIGRTRLTIHYTPGHTPGGTSWSWRECQGSRCLNFVYADSLNAVSADDFKYGGDDRYPSAAKDLEASIAKIAALPCDVLISAHPEASGLWDKVERYPGQGADAFVDPDGCRNYARGAKQRLTQRLERERNERVGN